MLVFQKEAMDRFRSSCSEERRSNIYRDTGILDSSGVLEGYEDEEDGLAAPRIPVTSCRPDFTLQELCSKVNHQLR